MDRHLSPQEVARRFGISIKALRLYERHGLLTPQRSEAGWRAYGPGQLARLHQIIALKRMGLPLARIGEILADADQLDEILAIQEQNLDRDSQRINHALKLVAAARAKLRRGQALSIDDLANLNQETVLTRISAKEINQLFTPFADRHISPEEKETIKQAVGDRDKMRQTMDGMLAEGEALMLAGDPASTAAQDLARRFTAFEQIIPTSEEFRAKARAFWNEAMEDPEVAAKMALNQKIFAFIGQAVSAHESPSEIAVGAAIES